MDLFRHAWPLLALCIAAVHPTVQAQADESPFASLMSGHFMDKKCEQLKAAIANGQAEAGVSEKFEQLCQGYEQAHHAINKVTNLVAGNAEHSAGKSVALGCTTMLAARNNGKTEWFERQKWYRKAMEMCTSISGEDPEGLDFRIQGMKDKLMSKAAQMKATPPEKLMGDTCAKLKHIPNGHEVRSQAWFSQAEQMCATVTSMSPDDLKSMLHRTQLQAETASGQLIRRTCADFHKNRQFQHEAWYQSTLAMCSKLASQKVHLDDLAHRCALLQRANAAGRGGSLKTKEWYKYLASTCKWIDQREFGHAGKSTPGIMV